MTPQTIPRSKTKAYSRKYDQLRRDYGFRATVDGTITRRKLEALQAIGYSLTNLAYRMGRTQQSLSETFLGDEPVHLSTVKAVAALYDELSSTPPPGPYANRIRLRSQRLGYAPPAAYDDINNPSERPKGVVKT